MNHKKPDRVLSLLGISAKAGQLVSGEFATENAIKDGKADLVLVAKDASANTKKHFSDMCRYRNIRFQEYETKEQLGHSIGKECRASLAILDKGLGDAVEKQLKNELSNDGGSL